MRKESREERMHRQLIGKKEEEAMRGENEVKRRRKRKIRLEGGRK